MHDAYRLSRCMIATAAGEKGGRNRFCCVTPSSVEFAVFFFFANIIAMGLI